MCARHGSEGRQLVIVRCWFAWQPVRLKVSVLAGTGQGGAAKRGGRQSGRGGERGEGRATQGKAESDPCSLQILLGDDGLVKLTITLLEPPTITPDAGELPPLLFCARSQTSFGFSRGTGAEPVDGWGGIGGIPIPPHPVSPISSPPCPPFPAPISLH